jgi:hypothetical protein
MQQALQKYISTKDINEYIKTLEKNKNCHQEDLFWAIAGAHYMEKQYFDYNKAKELCLKSLEIKNNMIAAYNIAYMNEQIIREKYNKTKEEEMLLYYMQAIELGEMKSCNQLGCYYINEEKIPGTNKTPEEYLLKAHNSGIIQGTNNLINLYKRKNNYAKCIKIMMYKFTKTNDTMDLVEIMLYMLNNHKYADYCKFMKKLGKNDMDMNALIKYTNITDSECPVCLETKKCFCLDCSHSVCNSCLFNIFTNSSTQCPICRKEL